MFCPIAFISAIIFPSGPVIGTHKLLFVASIVIEVPLLQLLSVPVVTLIDFGIVLVPTAEAAAA